MNCSTALHFLVPGTASVVDLRRCCMQVDHEPDAVREVPLLAEGMAALDAIDKEMGLAFDDWDKQYYYNMFAYASALLEIPAPNQFPTAFLT